jgi:hypothetical protein
MRFLATLGRKENYAGLKKNTIKKIYCAIFDTCGFLDAISEAVSCDLLERSELATLAWFLIIVIGNDPGRRDHSSMKSLLKYLLPKCSPDVANGLHNAFAQGSAATVSLGEFLLVEPKHDNDFPDDFKMVEVFPTVQELNASCSLDSIYRGWRGDPEARVMAMLDRQFRFLREDMVCPLREEIAELQDHKKRHGKPRLLYQQPTFVKIAANVKRRLKPHVIMTFRLPTELQKKCPSEKLLRAYLSGEGDRILAQDKIMLFFKDDRVINVGTIAFRDVEAMPFDELAAGRIRIGVHFETSSSIASVLIGGAAPIADFAIQARTSFISHLPILRCLQG